MKQLSKVKDPRQEWKVKHSLVSILAMCIVAIMCGATTVAQISEYGRQREEWFLSFLSLDFGIPSRLTIDRVLSMLDGRKLSYILSSIMQHIKRLSRGASVSLDGKSYLTPREDGSAKHALYVVNAWCKKDPERSFSLGY